MAEQNALKDLRITKAVGLTALKLYIENSNMEVGQVTVRHLIFSELVVQIRASKSLEDAENVFKLCFGNCHTVKEGKGKKIYESPLLEHYYTDEFGIKCVKISPRLADLIMAEVKIMEINNANVIAACTDLQICGRMFQELTIDATKTMLKVFIPYGEDMVHVHLNSREQEEDDFNAKCDWKYFNSTEEERMKQKAAELRKQVVTGTTTVKRYQSVTYSMNNDPSKTVYEQRGQNKIFVRNVADFDNELRNSLLTRGLEFADRMMNETQEFDIQTRANIAAAMRRSEMKEAYQLCIFFHDAFRTIQSYQSRSIAIANENYPKKSAALEEHVKGIKADAKKTINALSNQFRIEFTKLDLSELDMIYVLLHTVLTEGNNASYAHSVLEQEFFKFAIQNMQEDEDTPQFTEDKLVHCDFDEGEVVLFQAGKAVNGNKKAYAAVPLCGEFLIRKNKKGKLVASQKITSALDPVTVEKDRLIFITKPGGGKDNYTSQHLREITREIMTTGTKVTLVPYVKGQDVHDAIVINDTIIGSFRCSYSIAGKPVCPKAVTNMYLYKEGVVDHVIVSDQGNGLGQIAIVTLKDVKTVPVPSIKRNKIKEEQAMKNQRVFNTLQHCSFKFFSDDVSKPVAPVIVKKEPNSNIKRLAKQLFGFDFDF